MAIGAGLAVAELCPGQGCVLDGGFDVVQAQMFENVKGQDT